MSTLVSHAGITEALNNLNLKSGTQKADLVNALLARLPDQETLQETNSIPTEVLIMDIWGTDDPDEIKKRRKSLSSIKSSLNKSLKKLGKDGKNPEGIIISRDNIFIVSEEQKNALLEKIGSSMSGKDINSLADMMSKLKENLPDQQSGQAFSDLTKLMSSLEKASQTINSLQEELNSKDAQINELNTQLQKMKKTDEISEEDIEIIEGDEAVDLEEDELEIIEDDEAVDPGEDEVEIIEDDEAVDLGEDELEIVEDEDKNSNKLLEVLSQYMDPEEATSDKDTLKESEEGLVAQLLARFTPKFIKIPAGIFPVGSKENNPDEHPFDQKEIASFYLGQYPVTNDLFELFVRETGYITKAEISGFGNVHIGRCISKTDPHTGRTSFSINRTSASRQVTDANWRHPEGPGSSIADRGTHPVVQISREDAKAFATWAGKRLPSEDEWEAAAHGSELLSYPWGNNWQPDLGNFSSSYLGMTTPIERYRNGISPLGIIDLLGNVYEWTSPFNHSGTTTMACDGSNRIKKYILKGGCWNSQKITISHRLISEDTWSNIIGFRCAV